MTEETLLGLPPVKSIRQCSKELGMTRRQVHDLEQSALDKLYFILAVQWGWIPLEWEPEAKQ